MRRADAFLWAVVCEGAVDRFLGRPHDQNPYCYGQDSQEAWDYGWDEETTTAPAAAALLGLPTTTARRTLEDLAAHGVVERESAGQGKADLWRLNAEKRLDYATATVPAMSDPHVF